ncbi:MAG: hypothetical protein HKN50_13170, partial [Gammaproteobacteria bacterium]|nr:hypothetical protein [Gammaproteobacteria bacterium]
TPMAIYRHFEDKSDLIDAVLDSFVQEQNICGHSVPDKNWTKWLLTTYRNMYRGLQSMPSVYPYLSTASRFGPGASEVVERTLEVLQRAGFSLKQATEAANALNGFVIGCAIMDNAFYLNLAQNEPRIQLSPEHGLESGLDLIISALQTKHKN